MILLSLSCCQFAWKRSPVPGQSNQQLVFFSATPCYIFLFIEQFLPFESHLLHFSCLLVAFLGFLLPFLFPHARPDPNPARCSRRRRSTSAPSGRRGRGSKVKPWKRNRGNGTEEKICDSDQDQNPYSVHTLIDSYSFYESLL